MRSDNGAGGTLGKPCPDLSAAERDLVRAMRTVFGRLGKSLREFADGVPWDYSTVSRYLSGERFPAPRFIEQLIMGAKEQLSTEEADRLRHLYEAAGRERKGPEHRVRTLTAQVLSKEEQVQATTRKSREVTAALGHAERTIQRLRTQLRLANGFLDDDAVLSELERYAILREAGTPGAAACVSSRVLTVWCNALGGTDTARVVPWTKAHPRTPERRRATYDLLELEQRQREALDALVPLPLDGFGPVGDVTVELYDLALAAMVGTGPRLLSRALAYVSEHPREFGPVQQSLRDRLTSEGSTSPLAASWRQAVTGWDHEVSPRWTDTQPRTAERRIAVYGALGLEPETRRLFTGSIPIQFADGPIVIGEAPRSWAVPAYQCVTPWYWPAHARYLGQFKRWPETTVSALDEAAEAVAERLADPTDPVAYQTKGLVVGHVQSGKTANFSAVIAKAVDRGYRLVIVLSGSLDLLRAQTQRRLDMELVGRENILRDGPEEGSDYFGDPAWQGAFLSHGDRPSRLGAFDVLRLTTQGSDYQALRQGIAALEFEKADPALPLYDPSNFHRSAVRLMVVKKNAAVLRKVVEDLRRLGPQLSEIPVLIVDDEADHGSINTAHPGISRGRADRSAINKLVTGLLEILPRAQYVAYTATPFANVLISPTDEADLFPRDFVIALPRPAGYMGAHEFHDLDSPVPHELRTVANSNELAHVRPIGSSFDGDAGDLRQAMDSFLLAAAVKLYREANDPSGIRYRHHTMLIHESVRIADHRKLADRIAELWRAGDAEADRGLARLRALFDADVAPVSTHRHGGFVNPAGFDALIPYLDDARTRIGKGGGPVVIVNGDKDIESAVVDFDLRGVWKIVVGGAKLSRGFTVEGLTVTYFRRTIGQADSLMQMGRWFGFRSGYQDLVRLYIDRGASGESILDRVMVRGKTFDVYEAFEAVLRDEEAFRDQLADYAEPVDDQLAITPVQIPPLVAQYLPWLKPTSASKMFNARLVEVRSPGRWIEPAAYPSEAASIRHNTECWRPVLSALGGPVKQFSAPASDGMRSGAFSARTVAITHAQLLDMLGNLKWAQPEVFAPHLAYLNGLGNGSAPLSEWLVIAPQLASANALTGTLPGSPPMSVFRRSRRHAGAFGTISDPGHRRVIREMLPSSERGIALLYPVVEPGDMPYSPVDPARVTLAFALLTPESAGGDGNRSAVHFRAGDR